MRRRFSERLQQGLMYRRLKSLLWRRSSRSPVTGDYRNALVFCVFEP